MRIFIGYDPRQPIAAQVLMHSLYSRASRPISITPLVLSQLPVQRIGLTEFSFSRYLVPFMCKYEGHALFMDADMLCLTDICELEDICRSQVRGVCVVKNPERRFEWPSLMYFNNAHCKELKPALVESGKPQMLDWSSGGIGEIPSEWNHLVGYDPLRTDAKVVHFTQGLPCFPETKGAEYSAEWYAEARKTTSSVSWEEMMGKSVHREAVLKTA
jgi:hypothetical protein